MGEAPGEGVKWLSSDFSKVADSFTKKVLVEKANVSRLALAVNGLGKPQDSHALRAKMNEDMEQVKGALQILKGEAVKLEQLAYSEHDQVQLARHLADLQALLSRFQDLQKRAREGCLEFIVRAREVIESETEPDADNEAQPLISIGESSQHQQTEGLLEEIDYNEALILERDKGIREIASAMGEVHEIFRDLSVLVSEQQLGIDNIESAVESAAERTTAAARELDRANERRKSRAWTLYSVLVLILFLLLVLAIVLSL